MIESVQAKIGNLRELTEAEKTNLLKLALDVLALDADLTNCKAREFPYCNGQGLIIEGLPFERKLVIYDSSIPQNNRTREKMQMERGSIASRLNVIPENYTSVIENNVQIFVCRKGYKEQESG